MQAEIHKTELYGEAFATSRKGHTEATCNLDCRVYWRGKLLFNGGKARASPATRPPRLPVARCVSPAPTAPEARWGQPEP